MGKTQTLMKFFLENSFIDYSKFTSPEDLFNYIEKMKLEEYVDRMNKCVIVYNSISSNFIEIAKKERSKVLDNIIFNLKRIT